MEKSIIKSLMIEEASKRLPKTVKTQNVASFVISVLTKKQLQKILNENLTVKGKTKKIKNIINLGDGITIAEIDKVIENYPVLSKEQIMRYFKNTASVYEVTKISGGHITRPYLIELVEVLEEYTGLQILSESPAPLAYLEEGNRDITIGDIADFFSGDKDAEIVKIVKQAKEALASSQAVSNNIKRMNVKKYLASCCGCSVDELDESKTIKEFLDGIA